MRTVAGRRLRRLTPDGGVRCTAVTRLRLTRSPLAVCPVGKQACKLPVTSGGPCCAGPATWAELSGAGGGGLFNGRAGEGLASAGGMSSFLSAVTEPCGSAASDPPDAPFSVVCAEGGALSAGSGRGGSRECTSGRVNTGATRPWLMKRWSKLPTKGAAAQGIHAPKPSGEEEQGNAQRRHAVPGTAPSLVAAIRPPGMLYG